MINVEKEQKDRYAAGNKKGENFLFAIKDKINVLHVGYGGRGGAARVLVDIAKNHSSKFEPSVILIGYDVDEEYVSELEQNGVPCSTIIKKGRFDYRFLRELKKTISVMDPNIILFHTPVAYLWGRLPFLTNRRNIKIISVEHVASSDYGFFASILNFALSRRTDKIVCISQAVKDYFEERRFPLQKLVVIENGISVRPICKKAYMKKDPINITMVARLTSQKDHNTLLKAFKIVKGKGYPVALNIVGSGPLKDNLMQISKNLGISNQSNFMGERKDIRNILLRTDLFILSTHYEGLPISLLEAMEASCPIIATNIPSVSQVIDDGVNGILVQKKDEHSLANAVMHLIDNPLLSASIAKKGRELVESKYNIINTVKQYEKLFIDITNSISHCS